MAKEFVKKILQIETFHHQKLTTIIFHKYLLRKTLALSTDPPHPIESRQIAREQKVLQGRNEVLQFLAALVVLGRHSIIYPPPRRRSPIVDKRHSPPPPSTVREIKFDTDLYDDQKYPSVSAKFT